MMILARIVPLLSSFVLWTLLAVTQEADAVTTNGRTRKIRVCKRPNGQTPQTPMSTTKAPTTGQPPTTSTTPATTTPPSCEDMPYVFDTTARNWDNAKQHCEDNSMQIAMFKTDEEAQTLITAVQVCVSGTEDFWIGMKQDDSAYLKYKWIDNDAVPDGLKDNFQWEDQYEYDLTSAFSFTTINAPDDDKCMMLRSATKPSITDKKCVEVCGVICKK